MSTIARLYKDAELDIAGEINERLPKVCDFTKINIQSVSNGKGTPYIKIDDVTKINPPRSWAIVRLDPFGEFVDANGYDVFGNSSLATTIINLINNTPDGYTICIATNDEPSGNSISIRNLLSNFGFNILNYSFVYRCAWLGVFQKGANSILSEKYIDSGVVNDEILIPKVINFPMDGVTKSIQGIDCIHDNCTLTNNGIYVEEGTTNILVKEYAINYGQLNSITSKVKIVDGLFGERGQQFSCGDINSGFFITNTSQLCTIGKTYTVSCYIRLLDDNSNFRITREGTGGIIVNADSSIKNKYQRVTATWTENTNRTGQITFYGNGLKDICCIQLEEKPYATSYTQGTRNNSNNGVQIPTSYFQFPFSVTMEVIPDIKDGSNSVYGQEPTLMYVAGLWKTKSGGYYGEIDQVQRKNILDKFRYTLVFRQTNFDVYINSNKSTRNYNYSFNLSDIPMFTVGTRGYEPNYGYANALYKNIAFYTRELTQSDVDKLCNNKFSINKDGNINGLELIEDGNPNLVGKFNFIGGNLVSLTANSKSGWGLKLSANGSNFGDFGQLNLKQNTNYICSYVAWIDSDTITSHAIDNDLFPDTLPERDRVITNTPKRYSAIYNSSSANMQNCQLRFFNDKGAFDADAYITDIKFKELSSTRMSAKKDELHVNELVERSDL